MPTASPHRPLALLLVALGWLLAACEAPGTYPVSGETCGPADPAASIDASTFVGLCP